MDIRGKNVCFVAGFGGIGYECCKHLLKKGINKLAILDLIENVEGLDAFKLEYPQADIFFLQLDVTNKSQIKEIIKHVFDRMKYIDILVNGAGIADETNAGLTVDINLTGLINTTMETLPYMDAKKGGRGGLVVNIASVLGLEPSVPAPVYSASKFGVIGFTRSIGNKYYCDQSGVACIAICPGITDTKIIKNTKGWDSATRDLFFSYKLQSPAEMADSFVKCLELAKNGSIWICDLGEFREVTPAKFWQPTKNV